MEHFFDLLKSILFWYVVLVILVSLVRLSVHLIYKGVWWAKGWPSSFLMGTPEARFYWAMYGLGEFVDKALFVVCLPLLALLGLAFLPAGVRWLYHRPYVRRQSEKLEQLIKDGRIDMVGVFAYHPYGESSHIILNWGVRGSLDGRTYAFQPDEMDSPGVEEGTVPEMVQDIIRSEYVIDIIKRTAKRMSRMTPAGIKAFYGTQRLKKGAKEKVGFVERIPLSA